MAKTSIDSLLHLRAPQEQGDSSSSAAAAPGGGGAAGADAASTADKAPSEPAAAARLGEIWCGMASGTVRIHDPQVGDTGQAKLWLPLHRSSVRAMLAVDTQIWTGALAGGGGAVREDRAGLWV